MEPIIERSNEADNEIDFDKLTNEELLQQHSYLNQLGQIKEADRYYQALWARWNPAPKVEEAKEEAKEEVKEEPRTFKGRKSKKEADLENI